MSELAQRWLDKAIVAIGALVFASGGVVYEVFLGQWVGVVELPITREVLAGPEGLEEVELRREAGVLLLIENGSTGGTLVSVEKQNLGLRVDRVLLGTEDWTREVIPGQTGGRIDDAEIRLNKVFVPGLGRVGLLLHSSDASISASGTEPARVAVGDDVAGKPLVMVPAHVVSGAIVVFLAGMFCNEFIVRRWGLGLSRKQPS